MRFPLFVNQAQGDPTQTTFSKYILSQQSAIGLSDTELVYLAGGMFGAGADTTAAAISTCLLAAPNYPEAQHRVQEELDLVVGRDRGEYMR